MTDTTYNGWRNYETWCVHLWLSNDEGSYRYWRDEARRHRREAPTSAVVKERVWTPGLQARVERENLAGQLKDEVEHDGGCSCASLYTDLVQAALSEVDWFEIADAIFEGLPPEDKPESENDESDPDNEEAEPGERVKRGRTTDPRTPLFALGRVVSTPGALAALGRDDITTALGRHARGDWGDVGSGDWAENELSLRDGFRLLSAYRAADGTMFWVITDADRSVTTVLLPDEY